MKKIKRPLTNFERTGQLSDAERKDIVNALKQKGIFLQGEKLDSMFQNISVALQKRNEYKINGLRVSRKTAGREIEKLRSALSSLSCSSIMILEEAANHTYAHKYLTLKRISEEIFVWNGSPEWSQLITPKTIAFSLGDFCMDTLKAACEIALQTNPPESAFHDTNIIDRYILEKGRPQNWLIKMLCNDLANIFKTATGQTPTETEDGAFDCFLSACLKVIEPDSESREAHSHRKVIRTSLPKHREKKP